MANHPYVTAAMRATFWEDGAVLLPQVLDMPVATQQPHAIRVVAERCTLVPRIVDGDQVQARIDGRLTMKHPF